MLREVGGPAGTSEPCQSFKPESSTAGVPSVEAGGPGHGGAQAHDGSEGGEYEDAEMEEEEEEGGGEVPASCGGRSAGGDCCGGSCMRLHVPPRLAAAAAVAERESVVLGGSPLDPRADIDQRLILGKRCVGG